MSDSHLSCLASTRLDAGYIKPWECGPNRSANQHIAERFRHRVSSTFRAQPKPRRCHWTNGCERHRGWYPVRVQVADIGNDAIGFAQVFGNAIYVRNYSSHTVNASFGSTSAVVNAVAGEIKHRLSRQNRQD